MLSQYFIELLAECDNAIDQLPRELHSAARNIEMLRRTRKDRGCTFG